tara:strand:- start:67 stop:282 length:216 start_codon:yes stop_codon:yes gene_type:complete
MSGGGKRVLSGVSVGEGKREEGKIEKRGKSQRDQPKLKQKKTKTEDEAQGQMTIVDKAHRRTFSLFFPLQI